MRKKYKVVDGIRAAYQSSAAFRNTYWTPSLKIGENILSRKSIWWIGFSPIKNTLIADLILMPKLFVHGFICN